MPKAGETKIKPDLFKKVLDEYLAKCESEKRTPFKHELAYLLGISEDTMSDYRKNSKYTDFIKKLEIAGKTAVTRALDRDSKANVNKIFLAKAVFGLNETQKVELSGNVDSGIGLPARKR